MLGYLLGFNSETILDSIDFSKTYNLTYLGLTTYVFFFILKGILFWFSLTMPFAVLLINIAFITLNFLGDKNTMTVMRQSASLVLAFLPLIIFCINL
jgi:hypothetical protein